MSFLTGPGQMMSVIAVLMKRLGNDDVSIFQHELDAIAWGQVLEGWDENGNLLLRFVDRKDRKDVN